MEKIKFVNIENNELLTLEELEYFWKLDYPQLDCTFKEYLKDCMTSNNGSLEEVEKIDLSYFDKLDISDDAKKALKELETDFYKTNDDSFYTTSGHYFFNVDDLETIID